MNKEGIAALRSGSLRIGTWLSIGSPVIAELAADSGFDWLLFDLEHGCGTEGDLLANFQAIRGSPAAAVVRVGAPNPDLLLRVLDWGADGLMVPHVGSVAEAEECVRAAHYSPRGVRGFSRSARTYGYGLRAPAPGENPPTPFLTMQIETVEGVKNARAIAEVEGVDALFVGPSDLKFDMAQRKEASPDYASCLDRVAAAAKEAGKPWGILVRNEKELSMLRALGAAHLAIGSDLGILRSQFERILSEKGSV